MKVVGNNNGTWLVDDGYEDPSIEFSADASIVMGEREGTCRVRFSQYIHGPYQSKGRTEVYEGTFRDGELQGNWKIV